MMLSNLSLVAIFSAVVGSANAFSPAGSNSYPGQKSARIHSAPLSMANNDASTPPTEQTRRSWLQTSASSVLLGSGMAFAAPAKRASASAREVTDASSGELPDLPPSAIKDYLQYRFPLQLSADFYIFDLQTMVADTDEFGEVNELVASKGARGGQGGATRIEREYINPMRIIGLSMPPEYADDIRDTQFAFEKAMSKLTKATNGIRRDLPVEIDPSVVPKAKEAWEEGRLALNSFFVILNTATGLKDELTVIPPPGPNQYKEYGRSIRRYNEFQKKTKQCQNRGGPTLSAAWGQLMVTGYLQDSCGVEP
eukprot:CAMPEP_0172300248 /NCGR_PEP_ID=MMETSP1058-20130122/2373_1 /TAXON_ID=83371 /ORGANISM="Detonula confervacea, Strain CCMP 353" /LENGTH=309 /DNA_ID=CAMNT_0013009971 /DNA_START=61 /DNA_END=986 /DNA_ORIENTATION=-